MFLKNMSKILLLILLIISVFNSPIIQAQTPEDIKNHWAQDYIMTLLNKEIMETNDQGKFRPDYATTRGAFSIALAKELNLLPSSTNKFTDLESYKEADLINSLVEKEIISAYKDNLFAPEKAITRTEAVVSVIKALGIKKEENIITLDNYNPYNDIDNNDYKNHIKIATKLNLLTTNTENKFNGSRSITRAETAKLIASLEKFTGQTAYITEIYPVSNKISVNFLQGERKVISIEEDAITARNNRLVKLDEILKTDKVFIITENEKAIYLKAYGMVTKKDLTTEVSKLTNGILSTEEVDKLAKGDINFLDDKVLTGVNNQLKKEGLTDNEINALMNTEWDKLEELSKERLAEAISIETGLPLIITKGLFEGEWDKIRSFAEAEVIQRVIQELLSSQLIS
ncbi:MAG: S-layer homology domain-containing protein [Bacillota bacterium]